MAGWMLKASAAMMSKGAMKKRWVVLADYKLYYFESPLTMHEIKGEINCADVTAITEETSKKDGAVWKISYGKGGKEHWTVKVDGAEGPVVREMWWRKLCRSCPQVSDAELEAIRPGLGRSTVCSGGRAPPLRAGAVG